MHIAYLKNILLHLKRSNSKKKMVISIIWTVFNDSFRCRSNLFFNKLNLGIIFHEHLTIKLEFKSLYARSSFLPCGKSVIMSSHPCIFAFSGITSSHCGMKESVPIFIWSDAFEKQYDSNYLNFPTFGSCL